MEPKQNTFTSQNDAVAFIRRELRKQYGASISVGATPTTATERHVAEARLVYVRYTANVPVAELKRAYSSLNVTLSAGRGSLPCFCSPLEA